MQLVQTAPHEFAAHLLFTENGLEPFFSCAHAVDSENGVRQATFTHKGEQWQVELDDQASGLEHPGESLPSGREFPLGTMWEFDIRISSADDPVGERKLHGHIAPRWQGMRAESGQEIPLPDDVEEGVNVHVQGANIEFDEYSRLLERATTAVGLESGFFERHHPYSTVLNSERYVRIHEQVSGSIYARNGPITRLARLLENDRQGQQRAVQFDSDHRGCPVPGYYHSVTLDQDRVQEIFPDHNLPKEIKHYTAREKAAMGPDHSIAHPKICVRYQRSAGDATVGASADEIVALNRELEEALFSVLADAEIAVRPGLDTYVEDAYFEVDESDRDRTLFDLELEHISDDQKSVVVKHLADGLAPTTFESLAVLVNDGGSLGPSDIADKIDRHPGSVRRALNRVPELVDQTYGEVALRSKHIAELVLDAVEYARDRWDEKATEDGEERTGTGDSSLSTFIAWMASRDYNFRREEDSYILDFGTVPDIRRVIREAHEVWMEAGLLEVDFREASVHFSKPSDEGGNYLPSSSASPGRTEAWRYLTG